MRRNLILIILLLVATSTILGQEKREEIYIPFLNNEKFAGTYIFEDDQQHFVVLRGEDLRQAPEIYRQTQRIP